MALFGSLLVSTIVSHRGDLWGGPGAAGAESVKLVGGMRGIPLPPPGCRDEQAEWSTRNQGPLQVGAGAKSAKPEIPADVKPIPEFKKEKQPKYVTTPSKVLEDNTPPPQNAVPYGQGGSPAVPYTQFGLGSTGGNTTAGLGFTGTGVGDFGGKYSWYVDAVRNRVSTQLAAEHNRTVSALGAACSG